MVKYEPYDVYNEDASKPEAIYRSQNDAYQYSILEEDWFNSTK